MVILGIDPGFAIVGFGVVEMVCGRARLIQCGAVTTPAGKALPARLLQIAEMCIRDRSTSAPAEHRPAMSAPSSKSEEIRVSLPMVKCGCAPPFSFVIT